MRPALPLLLLDLLLLTHESLLLLLVLSLLMLAHHLVLLLLLLAHNLLRVLARELMMVVVVVALLVMRMVLHWSHLSIHMPHMLITWSIQQRVTVGPHGLHGLLKDIPVPAVGIAGDPLARTYRRGGGSETALGHVDEGHIIGQLELGWPCGLDGGVKPGCSRCDCCSLPGVL